MQRDFVDTYPEVLINFVGFFMQDDFRVTRNLTLNLGLRWDLLTTPVEKNNRQTNFSLQDGLIHTASDDDRGPLTTNFYGGWAPRLGVAYSPDAGRTAIRGAYGISYYRDNFGANGGTLERNHPLFQQIDLQTPNQFTPFRSVSDGLPGFTSIPLTPTIAPPPGFAVFFFPAGDKPNMAHMFNVGVQRQLPWSSVLDVAYVGTRGKNIFVSRNVNVPLPGPGNLDPRRPYFALAPEHPRHQSALGRCGILVRRASGEGRQALFPRLARAARLHLLEDGGHRVHPASRRLRRERRPPARRSTSRTTSSSAGRTSFHSDPAGGSCPMRQAWCRSWSRAGR